jgi:hypothetical protein
MNDKELLELAAKAAGIEIKHWIGSEPHSPNWNPLADDGDAFRLAVNLGLGIHIDNVDRFVVVEDEQIFYDETKFGGSSDPYAATRRAIVRVAAEIGKGMK